MSLCFSDIRLHTSIPPHSHTHTHTHTQTVGYDPIVPAEEAAKFNVEFMEMEDIWPIADFVTVHTPLIKATRGGCGLWHNIILVGMKGGTPLPPSWYIESMNLNRCCISTRSNERRCICQVQERYSSH